jgi:ribonucleoside-diphosphate reductase alpha chain
MPATRSSAATARWWSFEPNKIAVALMKAFLAVHGTQGAASASVRETVERLTEAVVRALLRSRPGGGTFHIEDVQDHVELGLMRGGHHEVARAYVLYRERRAQERAPAGGRGAGQGGRAVRDRRRPARAAGHGGAAALIESACAGLGADVQAEPILAETRRNLYDGVPIDEVYKAAILAARTLIEKDPAYTRATARLLLHTIRREILGGEVTQAQMAERYAEYFPRFIKKGVAGRTAGREAAAVRPGPPGRGARRRAATCSSTTWACRRCTTATSCTSTSSASRCRRPSSCAWPWAWR